MYQNYTDPELVNLWKNGQEKAFETLYKRYVAQLVFIASQKIGCVETAKEIVQDVFLNLFLHKMELQPKISLKPYLLTALKNKIYNFYQKELNRLKYKETIADSFPIESNDPLCILENKELNIQIKEKIKELPPQCKAVFLLSREEKLTYNEIAERLKISPNTVDQHIQKALRTLRTAVRSALLILLLPYLIRLFPLLFI